MAGNFLVQVPLLLALASAGNWHYDSVSQRDCEPGYDPDCSMPIALSGFSLSSKDTKNSADEDEHGAGSLDSLREVHHSAEDDKNQTGPAAHETSVKTERCKVIIPQECKFPFKYKDKEYTTCTDVDAVGTKWCSTHADYRHGTFKECKSTCKEKWPMKSIVGTAVAGGVAAAGLGLTVAAAELMKQKKVAGEFPPVHAQIKAEPASKAPPISHSSTRASEPAATARFLDKQNANPVPAQVEVAAQYDRYGWIVGFAVLGVVICCCICICGIAAACFHNSSKKQRQTNFIEVQGEVQPGYPEAYEE